MRPDATWAIAQRVLLQLRHDHRTVAMLLLLPSVVMALLRWVFGDIGQRGFSPLAPPLLALIPFIVMFLVASVTTLRERTSGTLDRLLTLPIGRGDVLGGYAIAFGLAAAAQAALAVGVSTLLLGFDPIGSAWLLLVIAVIDAVLGATLGLFVSAFASSEFQAVQFMPVIVVPQFLLCGLLRPRDSLPDVLRQISDVLPLSYAVDGMKHVASGTGSIATDLLILTGFIVAVVVLGSLTLKRQAR